MVSLSLFVVWFMTAPLFVSFSEYKPSNRFADCRGRAPDRVV